MKITKYNIPGPTDLTIAVVADFHEIDPVPVLDTLSTIHPDIIAICGDVFRRHADNSNHRTVNNKTSIRPIYRIIHLADKLCTFIRSRRIEAERINSYRLLLEARQIAPVVMSLGNHDICSKEDLRIIREAGIELLNNDTLCYKDIIFGGIPSRFNGGFIDEDFLKEFANRDDYTILLCHHPEYYSMLKDYPINLIFSGHAHGGQIRLFGHGLYAPGQGFFPQYTHGIYDNKLVVTAGCSNTTAIPRIGNPCEIVVVKIEKDKNTVNITDNE